jgi:hypothetical protein
MESDPAPRVSDASELLDAVHAWMTRRTARSPRSGLIRLDYLSLATALARELGRPEREITATLNHLLDLRWIEKDEDGWRVPVPKIFAQDVPASGEAPRERDKLVAKRLGWRVAAFPSERSERSTRFSKDQGTAENYATGPEPTFPNSPVVKLARETFPALCVESEIQFLPFQMNWLGLSRHINQWRKDGMTLSFISQMMEEFFHHPEWCRRSGRAPWRVFVSHRDQLVDLVLTRQRRDPGSRRHSAGQGTDYWSRRGTSADRLTRGANYWAART